MIIKRNSLSLLFFIVILHFYSFSQNNSLNLASSQNLNEVFLSSIDSGNYQLVSYLLLKGADPNSFNKKDSIRFEYSALMLATFHGDFNIANLLIKKGANVNYKTSDGTNALIVAAKRGCYNIAKLLIKNGSNVNDRTTYKSSALFEAVKQLNDSITSLLIENKAQVNVNNRFNLTPLQYSAGYNLLYFKLNGENNINEEIDTFIHHSKANKISELLINAGADLDVKDIYGFTPLLVATQFNNLELVKILCKAGANPNLASYDGVTPLMYANSMQYSEVARILFRNGAHVNYYSIEGSLYLLPSPDELLVINSDSGKYESVNYLLEHGANPNYSNEEGVNALMYASDNGSYKIAKLLIEKGADVNIKPNDGNTALFAAVRSNNDSIAELLIQNNAKINIQNKNSLYPLHYAAGLGYPVMTDLLLYYGAEPNVIDSDGNTPLMTSVYAGTYSVTETLINSGADLNIPDIYGNTPLMVASQFNDTALIRTLYTAGANLDKVNSRKVNALSVAIKNNSIDAFKMLVKLGTKTNDSTLTKNLYQQSVEASDYDISKFLRDKGLSTKLKPNIGRINFYTGFSSSRYDFMVDFGCGVYESISKMMVNFGYKYRPFSCRVLEYRNSSFYQLWEKRYAFYLSLQHLFVLKRNYLKGNVGITPGLSNELTWSYYRGLEKGSGAKWTIVPSLGLFYQRELFTLIGKWEIANYNTQIKDFNRFSLQLIMTIPTYRRLINNKRINWLD
ncbi:MAG: ankyrin repeat domain-containing protein [Bacteroidales bacterium]|nr:ankyrin repeat domain-containing protein [Bacteroidales bacterium]